MNKSLSVKRVEKKYVIGKLQAEELLLKLKKALPPDPYAGYDPYYVRSLYFDSYNNDDYYDKMAGIQNRKKIRIRIYDESTDVIKLELKQKFGVTQQKHSFSINRELTEELMRGRYEGLLEFNDPMLEQIYYLMIKEVYRPKCIVEYERTAFALPNNDTRITFDTKVRTSQGCLDLFAPRSHYRPADIDDLVVLEVKYNHFLLSYVKELLALSDLYVGSYSKYINARQDLV